LHWAFIGLDIEEKTKMMELQLKSSFGKERLEKFTTFSLTINGSVPVNPRNQDSTIVDVRLVVQAMEQDSLSPTDFVRPALDIVM
jgi:hypothetical protein